MKKIIARNPLLQNADEKSIQNMIFDYYAYQRYWIRRNNTGAHKASYESKRTGNIKHRMIRYGIPGAGDLMIAWKIFGVPVIGYIECKTYSTEQSEEQIDFQLDCDRNDIFYCVARCVEDVEEARTVYEEKMKQRILSSIGTVQPSVVLR